MLITDNGEASGCEHHPASPPAPPSSCPQLILELVDDQFIDMRVSWRAGQEIEKFANLLAMLCHGRLVVPVVNAAMMYAARVGEKEKGEAIRELIESAAAPRREPPGDDDDDPVICPTQTVKYAMKSFQG